MAKPVRADRGLTLLETMISLVLLALLLFSAQVVTIGLLRATRHNDDHKAALMALQYTLDAASLRARRDWNLAQNYSGNVQGFTYQVDELAPLPNPRHPSANLSLRRLRVRLNYPSGNAVKVYEAVTSVIL